MSTVPVSTETGRAASRARDTWAAGRRWCARQWTALLPGPAARRGAVWGTFALATLFVGMRIVYLPSGYGPAFDIALVISSLLIGGALIALATALVLTVVRCLPRLVTGLLVAACVLITVGSFSQPSLSLALTVISLCVAAALIGGTVATVRSERFAESTPAKKALTVLLLAVTVAYSVGFLWILTSEGDTGHLSSWRPREESMPPTLSPADPAEPGPYAVETLFYGAGTDLRRPEYGSEVAIRTPTVDASAFFVGMSTWTRWVRKQFWGFDLDALPLNARVWYPDGPGPFPLALIAHGNHRMNDYSDPGYEYLGTLLASRGFILASVDQNFLNGIRGIREPTATSLPRGPEQAVRGWHLLEHLRVWHEWNSQAGNPFYGKVDLDRIALMGHSRGGEAAATAVAFNRMEHYPEDANILFDYGYAVQAVVAIAPADGQYQPAQQPRWIEDVSYLTLQGAHDSDEASFGGSRQADRIRFTRPGPWFSTEIWAYRANHGQFNSGWGRADLPPPLGWFLNVEPLLPGDEQRRISKTYIAAFLEATLRGNREYVSLFKDWRTGRHWLPETIFINRYRDASFVPLATFQEDADLTSTTAHGGAITAENVTLWREGRIPTREGDRGYNGVFLGWHRSEERAPALYSISLPGDVAGALTAESTVELSIAALDQDAPRPRGATPDRKSAGSIRVAPDFTIELVTRDGTIAAAPLSRFAEIPPPLKERFTKFAFVERDRYGRDWEPVFQTIRAPLAAFSTAGEPAFAPKNLVGLRLKFDRTEASVILISAIGFGSERTAPDQAAPTADSGSAAPAHPAGD